jgi:hypothetical protein
LVRTKNGTKPDTLKRPIDASVVQLLRRFRGDIATSREKRREATSLASLKLPERAAHTVGLHSQRARANGTAQLEMSIVSSARALLRAATASEMCANTHLSRKTGAPRAPDQLCTDSAGAQAASTL